MSSTYYCPHDVILLPIPFADLTSSKVRPAIVIGRVPPHEDLIVIPLTSRLSTLPEEYRLNDWASCGLNAPSAVKPHIATVASDRVVKRVGSLTQSDRARVTRMLGTWIGETMQPK